jgi:nucleotide-binding universal stress UspA family protein
MPARIIVGTDLSTASNDALIQAETRARRDGLPLTVVHVLSGFPWDTDASAPSDPDTVTAIRESIRKHVCLLTGRPPSEFCVLVERGQPHLVLAKLARAEHALLVVGSHMHHGVGHALVRNVCERVAQHAHARVLVTRPRAGSGQVLVAADHPAHSRTALEVGIEEARGSARTLVVLHCVNTGFVESAFTPRMEGGPAITAAMTALSEEIARAKVKAELRVIEGPPQALISDVADRLGAELIVIGASHHTQPLADVTSLVLRRAQCSVLVVEDDVSTALPTQDHGATAVSTAASFLEELYS